ncbi:MAG: hypothetical protein AB3N14_17690 [Flavobacteriaceae bacterium]
MALLLLASTTSWTVEKHFCMGHLVDIAFFSEAASCGMLMGGAEEMPEMECCDDETIVVDGQDSLKLSFDELSADQLLFLSSFTYAYINLFEGLQEQIVPHLGYPPPLITYDLQLLDQVFLI